MSPGRDSIRRGSVRIGGRALTWRANTPAPVLPSPVLPPVLYGLPVTLAVISPGPALPSSAVMVVRRAEARRAYAVDQVAILLERGRSDWLARVPSRPARYDE